MNTGSRSIIANCSSFTANTIVKRAGGYHVISEKDGKNLGGPYPTRGEAEKRLEQVEYFKHTSNSIGAIPPGTPPQQGYDQWRNEIGSGQNQYPTGDQASPTEPQPLDEWEGDNAPRTGDNPEMALPSGWEDKRGGKGQQRPGKRPASRYQQPFGDQDVGQGMGDGLGKNYGPLEF